MKYKYVTTLEDAVSIIYLLNSLTDTTIGFDTETTSLSCHLGQIRLLQLATPEVVYVFDLFRVTDAIPYLKEWFESNKDRNIQLAVQNIKFDMQFLWKLDIDLTHQPIFDTLLAAKVLEAGLPYDFGLDDIAERFLSRKVDKKEQKSDWSRELLTKDQIQYAAIDAEIVRRLEPKLTKKIKEEDLSAVFELEMKTVYCTATMEFFGVKVDQDLLKEATPIYEKRVEDAENRFLSHIPDRWVRYNLLGQLVDKGFKVSSPSQVLEALQKLGIPDPEPDEQGRKQLVQATGTGHLKLLDIVDYPILEALLEYRKANKLLTSYIYALPQHFNAVTGRVHPGLNQMVDTGRFSSSNPNAQQLPRPNPDDPYTLRRMFIPEKGNIFVGADFSQIELRIMAELIYIKYKDSSQLDEFLNDLDPYVSFAAVFNGYTYEELVNIKETDKAKFKKLRQNAKAPRLGLPYGLQAKKFRNYAKATYGVIMTLEEAVEAHSKYFKAYPGVGKFHEECRDKNKKEMRSFPPYRRRRRWQQYPGVGGLSNMPIQSTSGDITKTAMSNLYFELHSKGYSPTQSHAIMPILTIH